MTADRSVRAYTSGVSVSELNKYLDPKNRAGRSNDPKLANIGKKLSNSSLTNFLKNYLCPGLGNGHVFSGGKVCTLRTGWPNRPKILRSARVKTWDPKGGIPPYRGCDNEGGWVKTIPIWFCRDYAKIILGMTQADTSIFVRWNAHSFDMVCFIFKKTDIAYLVKQHRLAKESAKMLEENRKEIAKLRRKHPKKQSIRFYNNMADASVRKLVEKIQKEPDTAFDVTLPHSIPLMGEKIVDLARVDPAKALKYITWLTEAQDPNSIMWNPEKSSKSAIGHGHNIRLFEDTLKEITKDVKEQRSLFLEKYNDYFEEKNIPEKRRKQAIYVKLRKKYDASRSLEKAAIKLGEVTREKKQKADDEAARLRKQAIKKGILSLFD